MHNLVRSNISIADSLDEVGSGLMFPKKDFFDTNRLRLSELYADYNEKAANNELHLLRSEWAFETSDDSNTKEAKDNKRHLAYGLYESRRLFVNKHWERLKAKNGGRTLYCPICGLEVCGEMDHYVPRDHDQFPEYSAHLDNLIPLCHYCNHGKLNKFLDENGERLFFNAYYDILTNRNILVGEVSLSQELPQITVSINPNLSETDIPDKYIRSTIEVLKLMVRFNEEAKKDLKKEMFRMSISKSGGRSWEVIKGEMIKVAMAFEEDHDIVYPTVLKAIANSTYMEEWFNRETNEL